MTTEDDQRLARNAVSILDAAVRVGVAEANNMARWIYASLFSLNMAGGAAGVSLALSRELKFLTATLFIAGIFFVLLSGLSSRSAMMSTTRQMVAALDYWIEVENGRSRDQDRELAQTHLLEAAQSNTSKANHLLWLSIFSFTAGVAVIAYGLATGR